MTLPTDCVEQAAVIVTNDEKAQRLAWLEDTTKRVVELECWLKDFPTAHGFGHLRSTITSIITELDTLRESVDGCPSSFNAQFKSLHDDFEDVYQHGRYLVGPLPESSFTDAERAANLWAHSMDLDRSASRCLRLVVELLRQIAVSEDKEQPHGPPSPIHKATLPGSFRTQSAWESLQEILSLSREELYDGQLNDDSTIDDYRSWLAPLLSTDASSSILDIPEPFRSILFPDPIHPADNLFLFDFAAYPDSSVMPPDETHQKRLQTIMLIVACLEHYEHLTDQIGTWLAATLALEFYRFEFYDGAYALGRWVTAEYRRLNIDNNYAFELHVGLSSLNLSFYDYYSGGGMDEPLVAIADACETFDYLLRNPGDYGPNPMARYASARALRAHTSLLSTSGNKIDALEAAQNATVSFKSILEDIDQLAVTFCSLRQERSPATYPTPIPKPPKRYFSFDPLTWHQELTQQYGASLHRLSYNYQDVDKMSEALEAAKLAVSSLKVVYDAHPSCRADFYAEANYHLSQPAFSGLMNANEMEPYGRAATDAYRIIWRSSKYVSLSFYNSLWEYAMILSGAALKAYKHAYTIWLEMAHVAEKNLADPLYLGDSYRQLGWVMRHLKRGDEAIIYRKKCVEIYHQWLHPTSKHEADCLHELAVDLFMGSRTQEASRYEDEAIEYYRQISARDTSDDAPRKSLALSLAYRIAYHVNLKAIDTALESAMEVLDLYSSMDEMAEDTVANYIYALRVSINAAFQHDDQERTLPISRTCMQRIQEIHKRYPEKALEGYMEMSSIHAIKLTKHNLMDEALKWSEIAIEWYSNLNFENAPAVVNGYLECLVNFTEDLTTAGNFSRSREYLQKVVDFGLEHVTPDNVMVIPLVAASFHNQAEIDIELGNWESALLSARRAMEYIMQHTGEDISQRPGALLFQSRCVSLIIQSSALARMAKYEEALETVKMCEHLCDTTPMKLVAKNNMFAPLIIPRALAGKAEVLSDMGRHDEAFKVAQTAYDEFHKAITLHSLPSAFTEVIDGYCAVTLAQEWAFKGDPAKGVATLETSMRGYRESVKLKPGNYPYFTPILALLGTLYCACGRHDDGGAVADEIEDIRSSLKEKRPWPELAMAVDIQLANEAARPSMIELKERLHIICGHGAWHGH